MEISQKTAEEEERYKKEMEKYMTHFVFLMSIKCQFGMCKISCVSRLFCHPLQDRGRGEEAQQ